METVGMYSEQEPLIDRPLQPLSSFDDGRKEKVSAWIKFFDKHGDGRAKCRIKSCGSIISFHTGNLRRHIAGRHPDVFTQQSLENTKLEVARQKQAERLRACPTEANKVLKDIVTSICVFNTPFDNFNKNPVFTQHMREIVKRSGVKWVLNSDNAKKLVICSGDKVKQMIAAKLNNRPLHLQFDLATRQSRKFLSVTASIFYENQIELLFLGQLESLESDTGVSIARRLEEVVL